MSRLKRAALFSVQYLLKRFPCVAALGARQVGKTTLLKQVFPEAPFFDLEKQSDFQRIARDPEFFLTQYPGPVVFDESQRLPELFAALRVAIDANRQVNGRFLISGSSSPNLLRAVTESLAGRVALFELGGLSLEESWRLSPSPFFEILKSKKFKDLLGLKKRLRGSQVFESCYYGSYPQAFLQRKSDGSFFRLWMENYFETYVNRDVRTLFPKLNLQAYQRFVNMLAYSSGNILNASDFARTLDVSQPTVKYYLQIIEGTFLWRQLPSYHKNIRKRIVKMPKGYIRDSGLLNFLLGIRSEADFWNHPQAGRIWESFITEEIIKGFKSQLISIDPYYLRTHNGTEIDLLLEGDFGIIPIEIKLGAKTDARKIEALIRFVKDARLSLGIVINNADSVGWLAEKIIQVPATFL